MAVSFPLSDSIDFSLSRAHAYLMRTSRARITLSLLCSFSNLSTIMETPFIPQSSETLISVNFGFLCNPQDVDLDNRDAWDD